MKLRIDTMLYGGAGSGHDDHGAPHAVPFVLPHEEVEISLTTAGPELIAIDTASPHRIEPRCPHFGPCGGCQYQHATYPAQIEIKRNILAELLSPVLASHPLGLSSSSTLPLLSSRSAAEGSASPFPSPRPPITVILSEAKDPAHPIPAHAFTPFSKTIAGGKADSSASLRNDRPEITTASHTPNHVLPLSPIQTYTAHPWHYRNRIRLRVALIEGTLRFGYNRRGSYEMLPITECPISAPLLLRAAEALVTLAAILPAWTDNLDEVELFTNSDQTKVQITLFLRSDRKTDLNALCTQLQRIVPEFAGAGILVTGPSGRKTQPGAAWGAPGLLYPVAGLSYWVSRPSFFQVNRFLVDELVTLVTKGRSGTLAWDLYAGVGLFSRALTETFAEVVAVETIAADLTQALKPPHRAVAATTADFLRAAVLERDRPQLIVADPPRAGLGPEVCDLLARIQAPQLVYVSCDPITLARDLRALVDSGYTVHDVHLVDLFPQTFHMETVVILHR